MPSNSSPENSSPTARLLSLDALRGFDMMWIVGADAFGDAFRKFHGGAPARFLGEQLDHVDWAGFRFYDLIFPLFAFMIGVSITFSVPRMLEKEGRAAALRRVGRRTLLLFILGLFYSGGFSQHLDQIRWLGVLQRLALGYGCASLLFIYLKPRALVATCGGLLIGYWALLMFVPVPGFGAGDFAEGHNLTNWLDQLYLPGRKYDGDHDPEGLLSTLPAIVTCLLGVFAGLVLRDPARTEKSKVAVLALGGVGLLALGYAWGLQFPIIKKIWTSSFVLVAGGWSALLLAGFYLVIDVWQNRRWAMPFVWLGTNSILIYMLSAVVNFGRLAQRFAGGDISAWLDARWIGLGGLVLAFVNVALCMAVCRFFYQRKIFLRV